MTSSPHGLYVQGYTRATMVGTEGSETVRRSKSLKTDLSSNCRLQLVYMKSESLVIVNHHVTVNMYLSLVHTARHVMEAGHARSQCANRKEAAA